ncbi:MAG: DUF1501 domain-containing protein [Nocardioidaceae bacterium]
METSDVHDSNCAEFHALSRRGFLTGLLAVTGAGVLTIAQGEVVRQVAFAETGKARAVLVVLSLRGGADGLSLVVPHGDPGYALARPGIAVPANTLLAHDAMFGLHPSLKPLLPLWSAGRMAAVHAAGLPAPNRSHFSAMEEVEDADPTSTVRRGWLNRMIGLDSFRSPLEGVEMGDTVVPASLYGSQPSFGAASVDGVKLSGPSDRSGRRARLASLRTVWGTGGETLGAGTRSALSVVSSFGPVQAVPHRPQHSAHYPATDLGAAMADTARLIRADVGTEVVTVDHGSWDMHANVGTLDKGQMRDMAGEMAAAVAAFFTDLGALGGKVTLVTISEFGRRVAENTNLGLDHGYGNVMFLVGAGVRGGRYYADWPSLSPGALVDGDLAVTTDYRSVLAEVLRSQFKLNVGLVFPGFRPSPVGAMTGA